MLNQENIRRANAASFFNAGDSINRDAENAITSFDEKFQSDNLTPEQLTYLTERREKWREFVLSHYNDQCRRRADYVPVSVAGPARYPAAKMEKRVDKIMQLQGDFSEKAAKFIANTHKRLGEMAPLEIQLAQIRAGSAKYETIPTNDPHVIEKLEAKIEHLESQIYKGMPAYSRQNRRANIKTIRARIEKIKAERAAPTLQGWTFDGGEVVACTEDDRLRILFDNRPDAAMIANLKGAAFRWSPRNMAWQRQLTANAVAAAKRVLA